ncbi:hypothetical protein KI387_036587, partial [Taxus chinensis]
MKGNTFFKNKMDKEAEENIFLDEGEMLDIKKEGILVSSILQPYDEVTRMMVCYVTLKERFSTIPQYHLVPINHFRSEVK